MTSIAECRYQKDLSRLADELEGGSADWHDHGSQAAVLLNLMDQVERLKRQVAALQQSQESQTMRNQLERYEVRHCEGYSNCDDLAGLMLSGVQLDHHNKADAIKAMKEAKANFPDMKACLGPPRIDIWDRWTEKFVG